jgi:hypothetical protein
MELVEQRGVVYCISRWYPTIDVGFCETSSSGAVCEMGSQSQVPRAFSFFSATANGVAYRGDISFKGRPPSPPGSVVMMRVVLRNTDPDDYRNVNVDLYKLDYSYNVMFVLV